MGISSAAAALVGKMLGANRRRQKTGCPFLTGCILQVKKVLGYVCLC